MYVPCLGSNYVAQLELDAATGALKRAATAPVAVAPPQRGPRHIVFHPDRKHAYVLDETSSSMEAFAFDTTSGQLSRMQVLSTRPEGATGFNKAAEVHVDRAGHFLYASNRGDDQIVIYALDAAGRMTPGRFPQNGWALAARLHHRSDGQVAARRQQTVGQRRGVGHRPVERSAQRHRDLRRRSVAVIRRGRRAWARPFDGGHGRLEQLARIFDVQSLLARIQHLPAAASNLEERLERMRLREDAFSELDRVALMIDATLARIEREESAAANARNTLNARHARTVVTWSIAATLIGSGVSVAATSLQFSGTTEASIGKGLAIGGAALAAAFSIVALTRKNRSTPPYAIATNFLAQPLGRTPTPASTLPGAGLELPRYDAGRRAGVVSQSARRRLGQRAKRLAGVVCPGAAHD